MLHELRLFFVALQFLTRVPVPRWVGWRPEWLEQSARHFPAVGLVVGMVGGIVLAASAHWFPAPVAVLLSMAATVWMTGAFHEDGFADTCDGLGGATSRERALEIMKDSRIGTYGAVGLVLLLAVKAAALHGLATRDLAAALAALPLAHAWSRAVAVLLLRWLPYAGDAAHAKAKPLAQRADDATAAVALLWCAVAGIGAAAGGIGGGHLLAGAAAVAVAGWLVGRWLRRRLGGITGDTLGAAQQLTELVLLLALLAAQARG